MELWYALAAGAIAVVFLVLVVLMVIGFVKGLREPYKQEGFGSGNSDYPDNRIQHADCFGTWDGYSVPGDKEGEWKHFDSFGICQGTSRNMADGTVAHYDLFGVQIGSSKKGW